VPRYARRDANHSPFGVRRWLAHSIGRLSFTISGHKSKVKRKSSKPRIYAFLTYQLQQMKPPGAPRQPLGEVSPNQRSRVVSARERSIPFPVIARMEDLQDSTIQSVVRNRASPGLIHQISQDRPTTTPHCNRPLRDTSCYCGQSKDNYPTAFYYMHATHIKEDCLSIS